MSYFTAALSLFSQSAIRLLIVVTVFTLKSAEVIADLHWLSYEGESQEVWFVLLDQLLLNIKKAWDNTFP